MSNAKHTPGPLYVKAEAAFCHHNGDIGIVNGKGSLIALAFAHVDEAPANARMFAAAPELLAALKQARAALDKCAHIQDITEQAIWACDAAIAKAEGEGA